MSGGSWEYSYARIEEIADRLMEERDVHRRALGHHMALIAEAMHAIEWVDSGDCSSPHDVDAIKAVLVPGLKGKCLELLIADARGVVAELGALVGVAEAEDDTTG